MSVAQSQLPVPTEHDEQRVVVEWARHYRVMDARLGLLYAIPNGGARTARTAGRLKAEGVRAGVPDLCLPCPSGDYAGLYVELKRRKRGRTSPEQEWWITHLRYQGYRVVVARGADEAISAIVEYLGMEDAS